MTKRRVPQRKNNRHMGGEEMLHKATKGWKYKTDNKLRGAFAETDFDTKTVRLNKKKHKPAARVKHYQKNANGGESLINSIEHELLHIKHPNARERTVVKKTKVAVNRLSTHAKQKRYALFKR